MRVPWVRVAPIVALAALVGGAVACVVEKEPRPPKVLFRDLLPPRVPSASASALPPPPPAPLPVDAAAPAPPPAPTGDAAPPVPGAAPSASAPPPPVTTMIAAPPVPDAFRACQTSADCLAVLPNGCCHDGRMVAVSKASAEAYRGSFTCPDAQPRCPMHLVLDNREPFCDAASHRCELSPSQG